MTKSTINATLATETSTIVSKNKTPNEGQKMKIPVGGPPRVILEKYWKGVFWQDFTQPDGSQVEYLLYGVQEPVVPSIVIPITIDKHVVAIKQFRYGANTVILELPGGCPKPGQKPEETLVTELREETGYKPGKIIRLNEKMWFEPAWLRVTYIPFLALDCIPEGKPNPDETECIEVVKIPLEEWVRMCQSGEIEDTKSVAITFMAMRYLE